MCPLNGWLPHDRPVDLQCPFVSHVYLWAGVNDGWAGARSTGSSNHASPLYCWREEQPLRDGLVSGYWGDMPHNWASAECILYLRHMFALEDGPSLRLLAGICNLLAPNPLSLKMLICFGRVNLATPASGGKNWRLEFSRAQGSAPDHIELPATVAANAAFFNVKGARLSVRKNRLSSTGQQNFYGGVEGVSYMFLEMVEPQTELTA